MKKLIYTLASTIALSMIFASCSSSEDLSIPMTGCNSNAPAWGSSLGTISRGQNTTIQGTGANAHIRQTWSGAVTASNCQKTTFSGGSEGNFNADCRSNPSQQGDLFSWCAVVRFRDELCPYPWRVPTREDFIDLDLALGGTGNNNQGGLTHLNRYRNTWRGTLAGTVDANGSFGGRQGFFVGFWSQKEQNETSANALQFHSIFGANFVSPQAPFSKGYGFSLRCVRDN